MKRKKSTLAVVAVLALLAVGVAVLAVLNSRQAGEKEQLRSDAAFLIIAGGQEHRVTMEDIEALGPQEIEANYKRSGKNAQTRRYTGVPFAAVLHSKGIDTAGFESAVFAASDGYMSIRPMDLAMDEDNCFIVIDSSGDGPFRMILAKDTFSQYWCKLLTDVTLQ